MKHPLATILLNMMLASSCGDSGRLENRKSAAGAAQTSNESRESSSKLLGSCVFEFEGATLLCAEYEQIGLVDGSPADALEEACTGPGESQAHFSKDR